MAIGILFLCHGNICRSPMAEFVMKRLVREAGLQDEYVIESAATTYEEIGNPVYPPAVRELKKHGISCEGKTARRMVKEDYDRFDYLIGMDKENLDDMTSFFAPDPERKISLLLRHAGKARSVADPWYTGNFTATWNDVLEGCTALLDKTRPRKE